MLQGRVSIECMKFIKCHEKYVDSNKKVSVTGTYICWNENLFIHVSWMGGMQSPCHQLLIVTLRRLAPFQLLYPKSSVTWQFCVCVLLSYGWNKMIVWTLTCMAGCFSLVHVTSTELMQFLMSVTHSIFRRRKKKYLYNRNNSYVVLLL